MVSVVQEDFQYSHICLLEILLCYINKMYPVFLPKCIKSPKRRNHLSFPGTRLFLMPIFQNLQIHSFCGPLVLFDFVLPIYI